MGSNPTVSSDMNDSQNGRLAERLKASALKVEDPSGSVGSNPTPSSKCDHPEHVMVITSETSPGLYINVCPACGSKSWVRYGLK